MSRRSIAIFIFLILILLRIRFYFYYSYRPVLTDGRDINATVSVANAPEVSAKTQKFSVLLGGQRVFVTTSKYPFYGYGQEIYLKGKLKVSEKEGATFYSLSFPEISPAEGSPLMLTAFSLYVREKAVAIFDSVLSPVDSALMLGIVFGIKQDMPDEFYELLRSAGVLHVIAASGMNVSMVAGALVFMFQRITKRRTAMLFSFFGIILYVIISGMEPSIVRAAIMAGIAFGAGMTGRQNLSLYAIFLTASFMLCVNPFWITDIGFQLSFLATAGIVTIKPILGRSGRLGIFGDDLTTTLAAQITTLPVILFNFGSVNLLSILVNTLVLWTVPFLMVIGGLAVILGIFIVQISYLFTFLAIPLLRYFEIVVISFDRVKVPLQIEKSPPVLWVGYYFLLVAVIMFVKRRRESNL